jgi:hypothetical protein
MPWETTVRDQGRLTELSDGSLFPEFAEVRIREWARNAAGDWELSDSGPAIYLRFEVRGGVVVVVSIAVARPDLGEVGVSDLRVVTAKRVDGAKRWIAQTIYESLNPPPMLGELTPTDMERHQRWAAEHRAAADAAGVTRRRQPKTEGRISEAAAIWRSVTSGNRTTIVANALGISTRQVSRLISEARVQGLLPASGRGPKEEAK